MTDPSANKDLASETAEALLLAIKEAAPDLGSSEALKDLADAYAAVVAAMPAPNRRPGQASLR